MPNIPTHSHVHSPPSLIPSGGRNSAVQQAQPNTVLATLESAELLKGGKTVGISHNGNLYRLQATRLGKLILTK